MTKLSVSFSRLFVRALLAVILAYLVIFNSALRQDENHLAIAAALPRAVIGTEPVRIPGRGYLANNHAAFVGMMEERGYLLTEQLGAGYFFEKDGQRFVTASRMYSSHFVLFSELQKQ